VAAGSQRKSNLLAGDPGSGKSAIASKLRTTYPRVAAFHIRRYGDHFKEDPQRVALSLTWKLATQLPDLMSKLNSTQNLEEVCSLPGAAPIFERLIVDPLQNTTIAFAIQTILL
jgi:hypothetical protein